MRDVVCLVLNADFDITSPPPWAVRMYSVSMRVRCMYYTLEILTHTRAHTLTACRMYAAQQYYKCTI